MKPPKCIEINFPFVFAYFQTITSLHENSQWSDSDSIARNCSRYQAMSTGQSSPPSTHTQSSIM